MLDELLQKYVSKGDCLRVVLEKPNSLNGFVYASNGRIAIKVPQSYLSEQYGTDLKYPDVEQLLSIQPEINSVIKTSQLEDMLNKIPCVPVYKECPECGRSGEIECEYCGCSHDCEDCGGYGTTDEVIGQTINDGYNTRIGKAYFNPLYLKIILDTARELKADSFTILSNQERKPTYIKINDVDILLMPLHREKQDDELVIEINN